MDTSALFHQIIQLLSDGDINSAVARIQNSDFEVNYRDVTHDLQTLLMRICYINISLTDLECVLAAIFKKDPDVNIQDSWGRTALMHACIANKPGYIEGLLEYGDTDISVSDFDGNTALSFAVQNCDIFTMEDILNHKNGGTLATKLNTKGQSPLSIVKKSGEKAVVALLESYSNKTICLLNKTKQRKPRNRRIVHLPLAYSSSPEGRNIHVTNRAINSPQMSHSLPSSPNRSMDGFLSERNRPLKVDLNLSLSGLELYSKCDSPSMMRKDTCTSVDNAFPLTSARLERHHHKRDCLRYEPSSLQSTHVLPDPNTNDWNEVPDDHLRKQRRPSISLPDLRTAGFLVQSGGSTPTSDSDSVCDSENFKDSSCEDADEESVFTQSYPKAAKHPRSHRTTKQSDKQFTLPEIGNHSARASSKFQAANHISPLARTRKYSNSDDQLQRTC